MLGAVFAAPRVPTPVIPIAPAAIGFPMLPGNFPLMMASELVAVQPMSGPSGACFAMNLINTKTGNTITEDEELKRGYCPELLKIRRGPATMNGLFHLIYNA